jgi:nucleotide sugar dehydrogenase
MERNSNFMKIGFIGQGFIGRNYANDFENRGLDVVRFAKEEPYTQNGPKIAECDIVFIAVPTPTTPTGFDDSILRAVLPLVGKAKTAVIKSTVLPGTTKKLQEEFPDIFLLNSPEFLREKTAAEDATHPNRNIIGIPKKTEEYEKRGLEVLSVLPKAPYELIADADETELIKYAGNIFLYFKLMYANVFYEVAGAIGADYNVVRDAVAADPRIGPSHLQVMHESGHPGAHLGRGAGGHCFIKDFAALRKFYEKFPGADPETVALLLALEIKNKELLISSSKDLDLLQEVYGSSLSQL